MHHSSQTADGRLVITIYMMSSLFNSIFSLPDELVRSLVVPKLSWKDLSRLDEAINNHSQRKQLHGWLHHTSRACTFHNNTSQLFLNWITKQHIKLSNLTLLASNVDDATVRMISNSNLQVEAHDQPFCDNVTGEATVRLLKSLRGLHSISISMHRDTMSVHLWNSVLKDLPNLRKLDVCACHTPDATGLIQCIAKYCKSISHVSLSCCYDVWDDTVVELAENCRQLEYLTLMCCHTLTDQTLIALGQHASKLAFVYLNAQQGAPTAAGVIRLVQGCPCMSTLSLWKCNVTESSFPVLSAACACLSICNLGSDVALGSNYVNIQVPNKPSCASSLKVSYTATVTEDQLLRIIANHPQLMIADMKGLSCVTNAVIAALANTCSNLRMLYISHCSNVTDLAALCKCPGLDCLQIIWCTGITDASLLQLAAATIGTPGNSITVHVNHSSVTAEVTTKLPELSRVRVSWSIATAW